MQTPKIYTLADGKYTVVKHDNGRLEAFRYGEPWRDLTGDHLIASLLYKVDDLTVETERLSLLSNRTSP